MQQAPACPPAPNLRRGPKPEKQRRHAEGRMLQVGDVAPEFELLDEQGKPTRLSSFRGRSVVVVFFPAAFSPVCTQELKQMTGLRNEYESENAAVIGISVDNRWSLKAFKRDEELAATLLSDFHPKGNVAQKYGVFLGETGYAKRGTFIIDKEGVIRGISVKEPKEARSEEDYFNLLRNCPR
jgi:peroxiredoxin